MKNFKNKKAFSLIELSIVLLIIGIIIAGITQSSRMIKQFRLSSARSQTQSSPASSIPDMIAWYDATTERSFNTAESEDAAITSTDVGISTWYDINSAISNKNNAIETTDDTKKPLYFANCINSLPCVRFDGTDDALTFSGAGLVGNDYTIFVVEQRRAANAGFFLGKSTSPSANAALHFGYTATSTLRFSQGSSSNYFTIGGTYIDAYSIPVARLHTFVNGSIALADVSGSDFFHYLNGADTATSLTAVGTAATITTLTDYSNAIIGGSHNGTGNVFFNGDIGEIIMYSRLLKAEERTAVEDYLLKKWGINSL